MAENLSLLASELKTIRTYLIKIGPSRRTGDILKQKKLQANEVFNHYSKFLELHKKRVDLNEVSQSEISLVNKICERFNSIYSEVLLLCIEQSEEKSFSLQGDTMPDEMFDLKIALSLLPIMTDQEDNTKQLIEGIEYYSAVLTKPECKVKLIQFVLKNRLSQHAKLKVLQNYTSTDELTKDMRRLLLPRKSYTAIHSRLQQCKQNQRSILDFGKELSEMFVDLTISQADGNSSVYDILRPLNEKLAIKRFSDGLINRRLSTIIAARNFTSLSDAIQAAQDEEVSSSGTSAEVMGMYKRPFWHNNLRRGQRGRGYGQQRRGNPHVRGPQNYTPNQREQVSHNHNRYQRNNYRGRGQSYNRNRGNNNVRQHGNVNAMAPEEPNLETLTQFFRA